MINNKLGNKRKIFFWVALFSFSLCPFLMSGTVDQTTLQRITLFDIRSKKNTSLRELLKTNLVIAVWSTSCTPCIYELDLLKKYQNPLIPGNTRIITINVDKSEDRVNKFLHRFQVAFETYLDPDRKFFDILNISELPTLVVFNRSGVLLYQQHGFNNRLHRDLDAVLKNLE